MTVMTPSRQVVAEAACCGTTPCDGQFEDWFRQVRLLYPNFQGKLCPNGVFENLMKALASPFWNAYVCDCGLCDIEREISPMTACCTFDRWVAEYGLEDDPCFDPVCFLTEQQRVLSLRAQLQARAMLEWGGTFNRALIQSVADPLGIVFKVRGQVYVPEDCDGPQGVGGLQAKVTADPSGSCGVITLGRSSDCHPLPHMAEIEILQAPLSIYATACSPVAQPALYNVYVEAFKCLIEAMRPCHLQLCFKDSWKDADPTIPPSAVNPCPNASGHYVHPTIGGDGTRDDPYVIDFTKLSAAQMESLARRLCMV